MTIGAIATLALVWLLDSSVAPEIEDRIIAFVSILAPLVAAIFAYYGILVQLRHQSNLDARRTQAELEAERAALPLALTRVCEIAERGIQEMVGLGELHGCPPANPNMHLEQTHLVSIKDTIKLTDGPVRDRLQAILRQYQPTLAGHPDMLKGEVIKGPNKQSGDGYNRIAMAYRWGVIYSLSESLFAFSRGKPYELSDKFPDERVLSAVRLAGVVPNWYTDFPGFIERAVERDSKKSIKEFD